MADQEIRLASDEPEEGSPAWVLTYGDVMSLLLVFFIFLVSFSYLDGGKFQQLANSLEQAFGLQRRPDDRATQNPTPFPQPLALTPSSQDGTIPKPQGATEPTVAQAVPSAAEQEAVSQLTPQTLPPPPPDTPQLHTAALETTASELHTLFTTLVKQGEIQLETQPDHLIMRLLGRTTFASGKAELRPEVLSTLYMIGNVLQSTPYEVFVAGHTDDQPIRGGVFKSNLALSAARAAAVVDFFLQHGFVSPDRIATMGYGEYRPVVPNTSEADRERNRRVEIILSAKPVGAATQPAPATGVSAPQ